MFLLSAIKEDLSWTIQVYIGIHMNQGLSSMGRYGGTPEPPHPQILRSPTPHGGIGRPPRSILNLKKV